MELRQLRHLIAVTEARSFTAAAHELHMSQPALSQSIARLEQELGCALLNRNRRVPGAGLTLTMAGQTLVAEAAGVLDAVDRARQKTLRVASGEKARVVVGFASSTPTRFVNELSRVDDDGLEIVPRHISWGGALAALRSGEVDITFIQGPPGFSIPEVEVSPLKEYPRVIGVPANHRLASRQSVKKLDLSGEVIFDPGFEQVPEIRDFWLLNPWPAGMGWKDIVEVSLTDVLEAQFAIASGKGLGLMSSVLGDKYVSESIHLLPIDDVPGVQVSLCRLRGEMPEHVSIVYNHLESVLSASE